MKSFFYKYRSPAIFGMIILLLGGAYAFLNIQNSLFPNVTFPKIKIIADNGEQPVDKMMVTVTKPLEEAIKQVPGMKMIRSTTSRGSVEVSAFLKWSADVYTNQQLIESRISQIRNELPGGTQITVERMNPSILPVMWYSLESKNKSLMELKLIAEYTIKPYLSQVQGVSSVRVQGGKTKEFWINTDPAKLMAYGLTPQDVRDALSKTGFIEANGYMNSYRRLYLSLTDAGLYSIKDIENVPLTDTLQRPVLVRDVATVSIEDKIEYIKINANGHEGVLVNILKQPDANLIEVTNGVNEQIKDMQQILPAGVVVKPFYQQSDFVNKSIISIRDALLIGLAMAIVVIILFLRSWQGSIAMLVIIPVTLAVSLLVMFGLGYTLNIMTIGAVAASLGLIIDDAVIVIEQMHRHREENPDEPVYQIIGASILYLLPAMIGSSLSTIVIFIPFTLMSGVAGAYFKILAFSMIITLTCSFVVTAILLPPFYGWLGGILPSKIKKVEHAEKRRWVDFLIRKPLISVLFAIAMIAAAAFIIPNLQTGFLPQMDEGSIVLDYSSPPGTSIEETNRILNQVDSIILGIPEVTSYSRRTGTQMGFFITEPNRGDYLISLKDRRKRSTDEVIADIRSRVEKQLSMLQVDFGQVISDMLGDLMTSAQPIELKVFGRDRDKLNAYAKKIADLTEKVDGTADVFNGIVIAGPNITIYPKQAQLARYGISTDDLQYQVQTALQGQVLGSVLERQQMSDVRMIYPKGPNRDLLELKNLNYILPGGNSIPLSKLARIEVHSGVAEQERENLQPIVAVTARLEGRDLGSVMGDIKSKIKSQILFDKGYGVRYGGAYAEQQQSFHELLTILLLASLLVLLVQMVVIRNAKAAFTILILSLLGMGGSLLALYVTGTPLNVGSYTGIIMIVGIIAENAIFTFHRYQSAKKDRDRDDALNYAIAVRLRPNLMTAFGAITALMPLALGLGVGAQLHQPLAIAVIGGFIVALPLLLIVFPSLLRIFKA